MILIFLNSAVIATYESDFSQKEDKNSFLCKFSKETHSFRLYVHYIMLFRALFTTDLSDSFIFLFLSLPFTYYPSMATSVQHTLSVSVCLSVCLPLSVCLSVSLSVCLSVCLSSSHSISQTHSHYDYHSLCLYLTHSLTHSLALSHTLSHLLYHSHSLSLSLFSLFLIHSLSLSSILAPYKAWTLLRGNKCGM